MHPRSLHTPGENAPRPPDPGRYDRSGRQGEPSAAGKPAGVGGRGPWASQSLLAAIVESSDDAIVTKDLSGVITSWNAGAQRTFGYTAEEAIGRPVTILMPPGYENEEPKILARIRAGERIDHYETIRVTKDGRLLNISLSVSPLVDTTGRIIGASKIARDITDRKRGDEARMLLAAVVESTDDAIVTKDLSGVITSWNAGAQRLFGYSAAEMIGRSVLTLIPPERHGEETLINATLQRGERVEPYDTIRLAKDGRPIDVSLTVSPLMDAAGRVVGASKIARDVTERNRAAAALARHSEHLNGLVAERTAELEQTHRSLRSSERLASIGTLAAGLGHDMGNLLLPVRQRLEELRLESLSPAAHSHIDMIGTCIDYLGRTTRSLRLLSANPDERRPGEWVDLAEWWAEVGPLLRIALARGIVLESDIPEEPIRIPLGRAELTQAVFNLVQNAGQALANRTDGVVRLWAQSTDGEVRLGVSDNGEGMTEEVRSRCLEPFFTTKTRGLSTGLGLAVMNAAAQRVGGSVEIQSAPGRGTTVIVRLPRSPVGDTGRQALGTERLARLSTDDARLRAYLIWLLGTNGVGVEHQGGEDARTADGPGTAASLWVADNSENGAVEREARRFLEEGRRLGVGRVVLLIGGPEPRDGDPRLVWLNPTAGPIRVRELLLPLLSGLGRRDSGGEGAEAR